MATGECRRGWARRARQRTCLSAQFRVADLTAGVGAPRVKQACQQSGRDHEDQCPSRNPPVASRQPQGRCDQKTKNEYRRRDLITRLFMPGDEVLGCVQPSGGFFRRKVARELDGDRRRGRDKQRPKNRTNELVALLPTSGDKQDQEQRKTNDGNMIQRQMNFHPIHPPMLFETERYAELLVRLTVCGTAALRSITLLLARPNDLHDRCGQPACLLPRRSRTALSPDRISRSGPAA